jgi:hypothetical protein
MVGNWASGEPTNHGSKHIWLALHHLMAQISEALILWIGLWETLPPYLPSGYVKIAFEHGQFLVDLPTKDGDVP